MFTSLYNEQGEKTSAKGMIAVKPVATYSIVAVDPATEEVGVAVQSKFLAVGAVVPWIKAGVGAVATQAWANTGYGPEGLQLLEAGGTPEAVIARLTEEDEGRDRRQVGIVRFDGQAGAYTGQACSAWAGHHIGDGFTCQGNILAGPRVVEDMAEAFIHSRGDLSQRMLAALDAGQAAGGDTRGMQSAALVVARPQGGYGGFNDRFVDLRVDDHPEPLKELGRLFEIHRLYFYPTDPARLVRLDEPVVVVIQQVLACQGLYNGQTDGQMNDDTRCALNQYMHRENFEGRIQQEPWFDGEVYAYLLTVGSRKRA